MRSKGSYQRILIILTLTLVATVGSNNLGAQEGEIFKLWPNTTLAKANAALDVEYMNEEEKQAVFYTNLVRINPPLFAETFLKDYLKANGIKKDKDVKDLIEDLEHSPRMGILQPSEALTEMARKHAKDMGTSGRTGHNSSDGGSFRDRLKPYEKGFDAISENCNYGNEHGRDAVVDLLIDRKVPNVGHRKNILDPEMTHIGFALEPHVRWRHNLVQDFGKAKRTSN